MRGIDDTDHDGAAEPAPEAEPECGQDNRDIVETLENVMQVVEVKRGQIMEQADAED